MMDNSLISIIIPAYNLEFLIGKTLDSVLAQSYKNIEVIVVNDGSTDDTKAVINAYAAKDYRVKAIHKDNGGVTSARLRGVAESKGEWIGFVDGDDYIEPDMYEKLLDNALKYMADISHCGYQMVFHNRKDFYYNTGRKVIQDNIRGMVDLVEGAFVEPGLVNKLFRKSLLTVLADNMDWSVKINEDLLMNYWLFKSAKSSVYEDFCPYHYIVRKGSAANSGINEHKLWDPLKVAKIILDDAFDGVVTVAYRKYIRLLIGGATMELRLKPELIKPYQAWTRRELRSQLKRIITKRECGLKLTIMALWSAIWPASYGWVHKLYARITGLDKIYDLE